MTSVVPSGIVLRNRSPSPVACNRALYIGRHADRNKATTKRRRECDWSLQQGSCVKSSQAFSGCCVQLKETPLGWRCNERRVKVVESWITQSPGFGRLVQPQTKTVESDCEHTPLWNPRGGPTGENLARAGAAVTAKESATPRGAPGLHDEVRVNPLYSKPEVAPTAVRVGQPFGCLQATGRRNR